MARNMKSSLSLTYVNHATIRIEMDGVCILTDPVLRNRVGFLRRHGPRISSGWCKRVDAVLMSHLHHDHLDFPSLRLLGPGVRLIVPRGAGEVLRLAGFQNVQEVTAGDQIKVGRLHVQAVHAEHDGRRAPFGPTTECLGFVARGSRSVYFAGDTDLFPEMDELAPDLDVALLPVWGWGPRLGTGHMNPLRAAQALTLLRPRMAIPIHWGSLCPIGFGRVKPGYLTHPPLTFAQHAAQLAPDVRVCILNAGQKV